MVSRCDSLGEDGLEGVVGLDSFVVYLTPADADDIAGQGVDDSDVPLEHSLCKVRHG